MKAIMVSSAVRWFWAKSRRWRFRYVLWGLHLNHIAGFLNGFDAAFVAALGAVDILTAKNTVYEAGNAVGGSYTTRDRVFPPSMTELGWGNNNGIAEGSVLPFYVGASDVDRIKYDITNANTARHWWLRSPLPSYAYNVRRVHTSGALYYNFAHSGFGLAAACVIY